MKPLKILIYAQWVYPVLRPRSHRTWQLAINLAKQGHDVTVYALLGKTDYKKYENIGLKIKNLGKSRFGCLNSDGTPEPLITRLIRKISGSYFQYPQIELKWMVQNSLNQIKEDIDLLITIGNPHTIHWGAAQAMPKSNIKYWIADSGDPFMLNPYSTPPQKFEFQERNWCSKADIITVPLEDAKSAYYKEYHHKIHVIPQGFDFSQTKLANYNPNNIPTFAFSGAVYPGIRDPKMFLSYLSQFKGDFKFIIYTKIRRHFEPLASKLGGKIEFREYVPRNELIYELSKMDFLINIVNIGGVQQPSKLIDYAQANRPILNISTDFNIEEKQVFEEFMNHNYEHGYKVENIDQFNIENVCNRFLSFISD